MYPKVERTMPEANRCCRESGFEFLGKRVDDGAERYFWWNAEDQNLWIVSDRIKDDGWGWGPRCGGCYVRREQAIARLHVTAPSRLEYPDPPALKPKKPVTEQLSLF